MKFGALVQKGYEFFTHGNPSVEFYFSCLRNKRQEKLMQQPVRFVLEILWLNLICRIPFLHPNRDQRIGGRYLSGILLGQPVNLFAGSLIKHRAAVMDLAGTVLIPAASKAELFSMVEEISGVPGFAQLREHLDDPLCPLAEIYRKIEDELGRSPDPALEEELFISLCLRNRTGERLAEIASVNHVAVRFLYATSYSRAGIEALLAGSGIEGASLLLTGEERYGREELMRRLCQEDTAAVSADYRLLKKLRPAAVPVYLEAPDRLMDRIGHPQLDDVFRRAYDAVCGVMVFSGERRRSPLYELTFLCAAPLLVGFLQQVRQQEREGKEILFLTGPEHPLFRLYIWLFGQAEAAKGVLDPESDERGNLLSQIVSREQESGKQLCLVDPVPGYRNQASGAEEWLLRLADWLPDGNDAAMLRCMTDRQICVRDGGTEDSMALEFPIQMDRERQEQFWDAVFDFAERYQKLYGCFTLPALDIPQADAVRLYQSGEGRLRQAILTEEGGWTE